MENVPCICVLTSSTLESTRGGSVATGPVACGEKWLTYENTWSPVGGAVGDVGGSTSMGVGFEAYEPILLYPRLLVLVRG